MSETINFSELTTKLQRAEGRRRQGDFLGAFNDYREILGRRLQTINKNNLRESRFLAIDMVVIERTAELATLFGLEDGAEFLIKGMGQLFAIHGNEYGKTYALLRQAELNLNCGDIKKAGNILAMIVPRWQTWAKERLEIFERELSWPETDQKDRGVIFARLYLIMGRLQMANGHYKRALALLEQGLLHARDPDNPLAFQTLPWISLTMGQALLEIGDFSRLAAWVTHSSKQINENSQPSLFAQRLELVGKLALFQGNFGLALEQFSRCLAFCQQHRFGRAANVAILNLSFLLIYLNRTHDAEKLIKSVLNDRHRKNQHDSDRANYLLQIAQARRSSPSELRVNPSVFELSSRQEERVNTQTSKSRQVNHQVRRSSSFLAFFEDYSTHFYLALGQSDIHFCQVMLNGIEIAFKHTDSLLIQSKLQLLQGILQYYRQDYDEAAVFFEATIMKFDQMQLLPELWQALRFLNWTVTRQNDRVNGQLEIVVRANELLDKMTQSLQAPERAVFLLNKWTADEEYIGKKIAELQQIKKQYQAANPLAKFIHLLKYQSGLNNLINHIYQYKERTSFQILRGSRLTPQYNAKKSWWHRYFFSPESRLTIAYLLLPDRLIIFFSSRRKLDFVITPVTRIEIRELIQKWHQLFSKQSAHSRHLTSEDEQTWSFESNKEETDAISSRLAKHLQISELLKIVSSRVDEICIVPDDSLNGFPFSAILIEQEFLIERFNLSFKFDNNSDHRRKKQAGQSAGLLVGIDKETSLFSALPGVKKELQIVNNWMVDHELKPVQLINNVATKPQIKAKLAEAKIVHIAAHGVFVTDRPDQSGIVLLGNEDTLEVLSLRELAHLNLAHIEHMTLSSCWGADNFVLPGRWIISLPESLYRAGVGSILGNLWAVDDGVAVAFMRQFYDYLGKHSRSEALRKTQLDCLHNRLPGCPVPNSSNLYYWAGFHLYGDSNHISL